MQEGVAKPQRSDLIVPEVFWSSKHRIVVQGCVCEEAGGGISRRVLFPTVWISRYVKQELHARSVSTEYL
jgi:hypothetical protein